MSVQVWNKNPNYDPTDPSSSPGEATPISGRVSSDTITNLQTRMNVAESNISDLESETSDIGNIRTNLENLETRVDKLDNRRYLFIGDSYTQNDWWSQYLSEFDSSLVLNEKYFLSAAGGAGFTVGTLKFSDLVTAGVTVVENAGYEATDITDLIFIGGANDGASSQATICSAGNDCVALAKTLFPNAKISIAMIGSNIAATARFNIRRDVIPAYKNINCARYLAYAPMVLHATNLFQEDGLHPNTSGAQLIAKYVYNAVMLNNPILTTLYSDIGITAVTGGSVTGNNLITFTDDNLRITFNAAQFTFPSRSWTYNEDLVIGKITGWAGLLPTKVSNTVFTDPITVPIIFSAGGVTYYRTAILHLVKVSATEFNVCLFQGYPYFDNVTLDNMKINMFSQVIGY